jgi:hypothetical protein
MTAATHREIESRFGGERDTAGDLVGVRRSQDDRRSPVHSAVEQLPSAVIRLVARSDDGTEAPA